MAKIASAGGQHVLVVGDDSARIVRATPNERGAIVTVATADELVTLVAIPRPLSGIRIPVADLSDGACTTRDRHR